MLCLEVTVNGEPYCVAGRQDGLVGAGVSRHVDAKGRSTRGLELSVLGAGSAGFERWDAEERFLKLGDVVTFRFVERESTDPPTWPATL